MEPYVGMRLWEFDDCRRVYRKDASGRSVGSPIWREHWKEVFIVGETRVSWLVGPEWCRNQLNRADKLPKKSFPGIYAVSDEDLERRSWVVENCHRLSEAVRSCKDYDVLKTIEAALAAITE